MDMTIRNATRTELYFKELAKEEGCTHKVDGEDAYSSEPNGQGKVIKLLSFNDDGLTIYTSTKSWGARNTLPIPSGFMPHIKGI
jgi:hypothetical protein